MSSSSNSGGGGGGVDDEEEDEFSLGKLSKYIVPPLGSSQTTLHAATPPGKFIISPTNSKYRCWETWMAVLVAYSAWVCPFEIGFLGKDSQHPLYVVDNAVDLFFAVDIVLTFFVPYLHPTTHLLVRHPTKIATR
ncbi:unnamed protein product [Cuscuta campestris]|uniref:Ion transport domain-containing protein n=1 Tax=Cuscuta campestris TaxID=132261 RepID=A0A484MJA2_9ASTE|nr:unnamed protein product [Cuscuta campestris]